MKKNKSGLSAAGKIISIALVVVALIIAIMWFSGINIPKFLDLLIPDFLQDKPDPGEVIDYGLDCPILIGKVFNDIVHFCREENCQTLYQSKIYLDDTEIKVLESDLDSTIGSIEINTFLYIRPSLIRAFATGDANIDPDFEEIKGYVEVGELLKLDRSYFLNSAREVICTNEIKTIDDYRLENLDKVVRSTDVQGVTYYYNIDDLIKNINKQTTSLYLNQELTRLAASFITTQGQIMRTDEDYEETNLGPRLANKNLFDTSPQDIQFYTDESALTEGRASEIFELTTPVDNTDNNIGINSNSDPFTHVQYIKWNSNIYVKFYEYDESNTETPYVLMNYWNAHRSFAGVPRWAKPDWEKQ